VNIEWDENKNRINIMRHGISFGFVARVFADPLRVEDDDVGTATLKRTGLSQSAVPKAACCS